jgi:hypothetical protein
MSNLIVKENPWVDEVFQRLSRGVLSLQKDKCALSRDRARQLIGQGSAEDHTKRVFNGLTKLKRSCNQFTRESTQKRFVDNCAQMTLTRAGGLRINNYTELQIAVDQFP